MLHALKIILTFFISVPLYSQSFVYSRNYFRWPVANKPGIVANFGELREGHWHMGLDIRTGHKENAPVYAAADGYIARVSVHPSGYGKAIYVHHPNGLTTVYGHLNRFFSKLDSIVEARQYKSQSWEIDLVFNKNELLVKKGQFIAYSGSTGSSQGPHVHFEIRNSKTERCINPLFFTLPVPDAVAPVLTHLAICDRSLSVYDQTAVVLPVRRIKDRYFLEDTIFRTGLSKLSFGIGAYDCVTGSSNPNGIYSARIFFDGRPLIEFRLDSMDYAETEYVNAHIDYRYRHEGGPYIQQLFKLPGDGGRAYRLQNGDGTIILNDTLDHKIQVEVRDIKQNTSVLNFIVSHSDSLASLIKYRPHTTFPPNFVNVLEQDDFELYLPEDCLYDSIEPVFRRDTMVGPNAISAQFEFCDASVPVHGKINVRLKPMLPIPPALRQKVVIRVSDKKGANYRKAEWQKDWVAASVGDFGRYRALIDTEPPSVIGLENGHHGDTINLSSSRAINLHVKDNAGIKSFRAELDDQWLMFSNDKYGPYLYTFDKRCPYGVHHLKVTVEDIVGNVTEKEWWFKRYQYIPPKKKAPHKKSAGARTHASGNGSRIMVKKK